jgi:hypothetical protein
MHVSVRFDVMKNLDNIINNFRACLDAAKNPKL